MLTEKEDAWHTKMNCQYKAEKQQSILIRLALRMIKTTLLGKGIRIDVYVKDNHGNAYDIEMQTTKDTDLHLRSRYYHSEMDGYQICAGEKYSNLKNSIVIFICTFDPFAD